MPERYFPKYHVVKGFPMRTSRGLELRIELDNFKEAPKAKDECGNCEVNKSKNPPKNVHCAAMHGYETSCQAIIFFNDSQTARDFAVTKSRCGIKEDFLKDFNERLRDF